MLFNLFKKKKEEPKPLARTITEVNYLVDTENADKIYKLIKDVMAYWDDDEIEERIL